MKQYAFMFFLISGSCTLRSCPALQYHLVEDERSWSEAQSFCRQNYTDLVTLYRGQEALLPQGKESSGDAWIGLRGTWQWSLAHPDHYQEAKESSLNWARREPNNNDEHDTCAAMKYDGTFNDLRCSRSRYFICYKEGQTPQYFPINQSLNWAKAQRYCKDHNYTGLAVIKNTEEREMMHKSTPSREGNWWIGLSRVWMWSDQSRFSYHNWDDTIEDETYPNCTAVGSSGKWKKDECSQKKPFYCYDEGQTPEYFPINQSLTWTEAQRYCKDHNYTGLAVIKNREEREMMHKSTPSQGGNWWKFIRDALWTGLSRVWMWSDQSQFSYHNWNDTTGDRTYPVCTALGSSGKWKKNNCSEKKPFYCYDVSPDDLILMKENRTWDEALDYCRRHHSDLVSVGGENLQQRVKSTAQQASTDHVWLGLRFSCALRFWHWVNADGVCYQNWASNQQDECGHMGAIKSRDEQKWYKKPKTERLNFICSKRA